MRAALRSVRSPSAASSRTTTSDGDRRGREGGEAGHNGAHDAAGSGRASRGSRSASRGSVGRGSAGRGSAGRESSDQGVQAVEAPAVEAPAEEAPAEKLRKRQRGSRPSTLQEYRETLPILQERIAEGSGLAQIDGKRKWCQENRPYQITRTDKLMLPKAKKSVAPEEAIVEIHWAYKPSESRPHRAPKKKRVWFRSTTSSPQASGRARRDARRACELEPGLAEALAATRGRRVLVEMHGAPALLEIGGPAESWLHSGAFMRSHLARSLRHGCSTNSRPGSLATGLHALDLVWRHRACPTRGCGR